MRRHPRLVRAGTIAAAAALLLALGSSAFAVLQGQLRAARERAFEAESAEARELMRQIVEGAERARCLVNTTTGTPDQVKEGLTGCEQTLASYERLTHVDEQQHSGWQRLEPDQQRPTPETLIDYDRRRQLLAALLLGVAEPYRETLLLYYVEELPSAEIERRLGIRAGTVRSRLRRGLAQLRAELDRHHGERRGWVRALVPVIGRPPAPPRPVRTLARPLVSWLAAGMAMGLLGLGLGLTPQPLEPAGSSLVQ